MIFFLFKDKPLPPQGPIDVTDLTPETCLLSWKPPLDDGGSPITNYIIDKYETSTGVSILCHIKLYSILIFVFFILVVVET